MARVRRTRHHSIEFSAKNITEFSCDTTFFFLSLGFNFHFPQEEKYKNNDSYVIWSKSNMSKKMIHFETAVKINFIRV